jgi:3',5'-cyclic AMP phosphodiesterase CpdA
MSRALFNSLKAHIKQHPAAISLFLLCLLLLVGIQIWLNVSSPPAQNWLAENIQNIKVSDPGDYAFAVFGDNKNSHTIFPKLLQELGRDQEVRFAMDLGDIVPGGEMEKYRYFFTQVRKNLNIPLLTAIGNHDLEEKGRGLYYDLLGPFYYSFKIGRDYFIVIDDADEGRLDPWQRLWLESELQKAAQYSHRFVFMHVPLFDPRGFPYHHRLGAGPAQALLDLFKKYKVSHIFASHIHSYYTGKWEGLPFTITGGGGATLVGKDPEHDFFHYLKVRVTGEHVDIAAVPVATPDQKWLNRIGAMAWRFLYAMVRFHGVEMAILVLMGYFLGAAFKKKETDNPRILLDGAMKVKQ